MMLDRLFVYGTLMRGFDHPMAKLLSANADFIGEVRCRGRLYLVKHYPGLVLSDDADDIVFGELFRLRAPEALLREFDMYEACGDGFVFHGLGSVTVRGRSDAVAIFSVDPNSQGTGS